MKKPSKPKGVRDFWSSTLHKRNFVISSIKNIFSTYGFEELETPAFENREVLTEKYGDEGDKLIFKILKSGDFLDKVSEGDLEKSNSKKLGSLITDKALRYDLTIPLARFVAQNHNDISFPFKRFQIQPVWRADRPQKGRYREFYQCDADIIGSNSLWQEVELIKLYDNVFETLDLENEIQIVINNRKILSGILISLGVEDKFKEISALLDKSDKISKDEFLSQLNDIGIGAEKTKILNDLINLEKSNSEKLEYLENFMKESELGTEGISEMSFILDKIKELNIKSNIVFDLKLVRGLDYYTGTIFEIKPTNVQLGSLGGGGRYDNLTEMFGLKDKGGIGISFGLDRICLVLEELEKFPAKLDKAKTEILFLNLCDEGANHSFKFVTELRKIGISADLYPDNIKIKKQLSYADKKKIPKVAFIGGDEVQSKTILMKDMDSGNQEEIPFSDFMKHFE